MRGAIHSLLQYAFMAWCLVKHRDNFTRILIELLHAKFMPHFIGRVLVCKKSSDVCHPRPSLGSTQTGL
jgi:hypothetical protein